MAQIFILVNLCMDVMMALMLVGEMKDHLTLLDHINIIRASLTVTMAELFRVTILQTIYLVVKKAHISARHLLHHQKRSQPNPLPIQMIITKTTMKDFMMGQYQRISSMTME